MKTKTTHTQKPQFLTQMLTKRKLELWSVHVAAAARRFQLAYVHLGETLTVCNQHFVKTFTLTICKQHFVKTFTNMSRANNLNAKR